MLQAKKKWVEGERVTPPSAEKIDPHPPTLQCNDVLKKESKFQNKVYEIEVWIQQSGFTFLLKLLHMCFRKLFHTRFRKLLHMGYHQTISGIMLLVILDDKDCDDDKN